MHFICHRLDIPEGESKGFVINDQSLFGVRHDGQIYFYWNRCPHLGVEMDGIDDQFLGDSPAIIKCNVHGALFLTESGQCISGPCQGQKLIPAPTSENNDKFYLVENV